MAEYNWYQFKKIAMAVASACQDIGHEYRSQQLLKQQLALGKSPTGRTISSQPEYQELPKE